MRTQGCEYAATPAPTADWVDWPAFSRAGLQPIHQCDKDSRYKPNLRTGDRADRPENSRHRLVAHVLGHPAVALILPKMRSESRRVGKVCVSTCSSRRTPLQ